MLPDYSEHCPAYSMIDDNGKVKYYGMYIRPHIRNKWVLTSEVRKLENVTKGCVKHLDKVIFHNVKEMRTKSCGYRCQFNTFIKGAGTGGVIGVLLVLAIIL